LTGGKTWCQPTPVFEYARQAVAAVSKSSDSVTDVGDWLCHTRLRLNDGGDVTGLKPAGRQDWHQGNVSQVDSRSGTTQTLLGLSLVLRSANTAA